MSQFKSQPLIQNILLSILIFASAILLASCSLPQPEESKDTGNSATFFVERTKVEVTGQQLDSKISIPLSKTFSFTACFKDSQRSKAVINHEFSIKGGSEEQAATTDSNGCLIWTEKLAYNHLAPAKTVEVRRSFETHGFQKGQRQISFALNPWEDQGYSLTDTKLGSYVKSTEAAAAFQGQTAELAPLSMEDLRLTIKEESISEKGVNLSLSLSGALSLATLKASGQKSLELLTYGSFDVEILLISSMSENKKESIRALTAPIKVQANIAGNALAFKTHVTLAPMTRYGQIQLGIKIKATGTDLPLAPLEAIFPIAEYDQIKGNFMLKRQSLADGSLEKKAAFSLDSYINDKPVVNQNSGAESTEAVRKAQVIVTPLKFSQVGFKGHDGLKREKVFSVTACMRAPIDNKPLRAQTFTVTKLNQTTVKLPSNDEGCVTWDESLPFEFLGNECWVDGKIQIQNGNLGMNQSLQLKINPWDLGESSIRDLRMVSQQKLACAEGKSKIILTGYSFDKKNNTQYSIDRFLNLKIQKEVILKLQPHLKRPSLTDPTGFEEAPLPNGDYQLRWALLSSQVQDFKKPAAGLYQVQSKTVQVRGAGTISESIVLETPDLKSIGNTSQILIEITPVDQAMASRISVTTFRGPLVLANSSQGANLEILQESDSSLIQGLTAQLQELQNQKLAANSELSKKEFMARNENLVLYNLNDEKSTEPLRKSLAAPGWFIQGVLPFIKNKEPIPQADLINWVSTGKVSNELATKLRNYWCTDRMRRPLSTKDSRSLVAAQGLNFSRLAAYCVNHSKSFQDFFDLQYQYILQSPSKIQDQSFQLRDVSFNAAFTVNHAQGMSESSTFSVDASAGFGTPKFFGFSASTGARVQHSWTHAEQQGTNVTQAFQSGFAAMVERLNFKIRAEGFEKCAVIRMNPRLYLGDKAPLASMFDSSIPVNQRNQALHQGLMICMGSVLNKPIEMSESYFIFNQKTFNSQAVDANADAGRALFVSLRGLTDFKKFLNLVSGRLSIPDNASSEAHVSQMMSDNAEADFLKGTSAYPGVFTAEQ
jgi:hypothetical protein